MPLKDDVLAKDPVLSGCNYFYCDFRALVPSWRRTYFHRLLHGKVLQ